MKIKIFHILSVLDYPGAAASLSSPLALIENLQSDLELWKRFRMGELSREENKRSRKKVSRVYSCWEVVQYHHHFWWPQADT